MTNEEQSMDTEGMMGMSISQLMDFAKTAFDAKLEALDLEGKLLVVKSDNLSDGMLASLQEGLKKQGSKVLGVVGVDGYTDLAAFTVEDLEEMLKVAKEAKESNDTGA